MSSWSSYIDHVYILCDPKKEPDRASYLTKWFESSNIPKSQYTFFSFCYWDTLSAKDAWAIYDPWNQRRSSTHRSANSYNLKLGEISLCINWAAVAYEAVKANHKIVMFWESDVLPDSDFIPKLENAMKLLETKHGNEWDFLSISAGANLRPERAQNDTTQDWFPVKNPLLHTRTTDAMIFKVDLLRRLLPTFFPVAEVLDWELNFHLTAHKSRSFWLDPPIIKQGSGTVYATTL